MAPSQMEHQQEQSLGQGYTHKKFNCSYSHKKLGMRLRQREENQQKNMNQPEEEQHQQQANKKQSLFRPYALHNDTPRKRKISRSSDSSDDENSQSSFNGSTQTSYMPTTFYQHLEQSTPVIINSAPTCSTPALSPNSYAERLQRQRAALYMRYMQQFHSGHLAATAQSANTSNGGAHYPPMGYPNVTAPLYNNC